MSDPITSALQSAYRYLGFCPRTETEVHQYLAKKGYDGATIDEVVERLRQQRYLDDTGFATQYITAHRNWGARRLGVELRRRGVEPSVVDEVVSRCVDDRQRCLEAAQYQAKRLEGLGRQTMRRRLHSFLLRRGFSYDAIAYALDSVVGREDPFGGLPDA